MEVVSMPYRLPTEWRSTLITAIARMLGKAVKVRYCPATVSATALIPVDWEHRRRE